MKTIRVMERMIALVIVLLLGGMALQVAAPEAGAPAQAQTGGPGLGYTIQADTVAGGGYQVTSLSWRVTGAASGGSYSLSISDQPALRGNGCCCNFLPLTLRNY